MTKIKKSDQTPTGDEVLKVKKETGIKKEKTDQKQTTDEVLKVKKESGIKKAKPSKFYLRAHGLPWSITKVSFFFVKFLIHK